MVRCLMGAARLNLFLAAAVAISLSGGVCHAAAGGGCPGDADCDTILDAADNCPNIPNAGQANSDTDFQGDACDNCDTVNNVGQANQDGDTWVTPVTTVRR